VADRAIAFTNVFNFRDLGGYRSADGRSVRWRRLFRSDDLSRLRADEAGRFLDLGIRTVVDLRRPHEIAEDGRILPLDGCAYHHVHLTHPAWPPRDFVDTAQRSAFVVERYLEIADVAADGLGRALRLIADPQAAPLVVHCIAGKDRTGVVSALTLALLGVPDEDIADDYTMSELVEPQSWAYIMRDRPDKLAERWSHLTVSPREGMLRFLDELRARHGSIEAYAASVGVSADHVDAMRAHLLEDALDPAVRVGPAPALDVHKGLA
jgi:protein-tyrosine phosphatase